MPETIFLSGGNLTVLDTSSISESSNVDKKTILVSVLGVENANKVLIDLAEGKKYCSTLINKPIVAYLKFDKSGQPNDFGGHELKKKYNADKELVYYFATTPIGTHTDARVEKREIKGYGKVDCIVADIELWASRFPEYYDVAEKLIEEGSLSTSWEIDTKKYEFANGIKKLIDFEFIGNAFLGSTVTPAVSGAGVITSEVDVKLREAIRKDLLVASVEREDCVLENEKEVEIVVEDVVVDNAETVVNEPEVVEPVVEATLEEPVATVSETEPESTVVASLTPYDIYNELYNLFSEEVFSSFGFDNINKWGLDLFVLYPEEHTIIYRVYGEDKQSIMLKIVYAINADVVSIVSMNKVEMTFVDVAEIEENKNKVTELSGKLVEVNTELENTKTTIAELSGFKEIYDKAQADLAEVEKQKSIDSMKEKYVATKMIAESEFEEVEELKIALSELDENKLKMIVADRILDGRKPDVSEVTKPDTKEEVKREVKEKLNISNFSGFKSDSFDKKDGSSVNKFIYGY